MTIHEAERVVVQSADHLGGVLPRIITYPCDGGFAVALPVAGQPDFAFVLTEYDVNAFETLQAALAAPPIVRLAHDA